MSDILGIILLVFLGYSNSVRAKQKGLNGILWAFITIASYIIAQGIGLFIVISCFCQDAVDMSIFSKNINNFHEVSKQFNQQVETALLANPLREITVFLFGLGGFLLIRFILDRKPDKKTPDAHWMDKLGEQ
jgi:hypothetical protein